MADFKPQTQPPGAPTVPQPPGAPTVTQPPASSKENKPQAVPVATAVWFAASLIPALIFSAGAAKLSYDRFQSIGWAIVAFLFAPIYYMYYAFFVSTTATPAMIAAARRAMKW